jgi:hypothetical protein
MAIGRYAFLNRDAVDKAIDFDWLQNEVNDDLSKRATSFVTMVNYTIRDVWAHNDTGYNAKIT